MSNLINSNNPKTRNLSRHSSRIYEEKVLKTSKALSIIKTVQKIKTFHANKFAVKTTSLDILD